MLAHNIKEVLTLVPEALPLVKEASLEKDFPVDSRSSAAASFLVANYLEKVAHKPISTAVFSLIKKAIDLYELKDEVEPLVGKLTPMQKQASNESTVELEQSMFDDNISGLGFFSLEKVASVAESIVEKFGYQVTSPHVKLYSCSGWLDKEAAVKALTSRVIASNKKELGYVKIAQIICNNVKENDQSAIREVCRTVSALDKKAGLDIMGFNFYKEAMVLGLEKMASILSVSVAGEQFPYEKVAKFGKDRIGTLLGKDIAAGMNGDPVNDKAVIESLPRDLQLVLKAGLKNV